MRTTSSTIPSEAITNDDAAPLAGASATASTVATTASDRELSAQATPQGPRVAAYLQLARPRIVALVLLTMAVAALVGAVHPPTTIELLHGLLGVGLVIVGAVTFNQRFEAASDALMKRTSRRPLPSGRLSRAEVTRFGIVSTAVGLLYLIAFTNHVLLLLTLASWIIYVWIYTPLKAFTAWQTPIGAIPGAMPALLGTALSGSMPTATGWALFGVVYFWQFPHAMAIAWLYRQQFSSAGIRVASVVDPSGRLAAALGLIGGLVLMPVSLLPLQTPGLGWGYAAWAVMLNVVYLAASFAWFVRRDDATARRLLHVSLVYLPALYLGLGVAMWLG